MRNFRKLLKDFWSGLLGLLFMGLFLAAAVFFGVMKNTLEGAIVILLCYVFFSTLILIAVIIYSIVIFVSYSNAKLKLQAIPGFSAERFGRETDRMPKIGNLVLCSDAICFAGRYSQVSVIPIKDIVWVYQEQVQNVLFLQIHTNAREKYSLQMIMRKKYGNREMACRFLLRLIARKNKGAIIGYKESYDQMYQNHFEQMLEMTKGKEVVDSRLLEQEYIQNDYYTRDLQ